MRRTEARTSLAALAVLVLALVAPSVSEGVEADGVKLSCRQVDVFAGVASSSGAIYLTRRPIVRASDAIEIDGIALVRDVDYTIDYAQGIVYLAPKPATGTPVRVSYSVLPFDLKLSYRLRDVSEGPLAAPAPAALAPVRSKKPAYDLRASGSKTISVEAGSLTDPRVSQALSLTISGKVGEGVEVRGALSDKDMTLGQSATSDIGELDRIFMEVRSPRAFARVGDLEISEAPGELLAFKRNLTGFLGDASIGGEKIVLSGAQSRTRHRTVEIAGREGISGPYAVVGADGDLAGMVTNSEKVWLDGEPLKRGRGADYVIDYERGEVYFNPSCLVRDGARVVVDYESRSESGERQFYYARSSAGLGKRSDLAVSFLSETAGLGADGAEGKAVAGGGGEWEEGAKFVGLGGGDYVQVMADSVVCYEYAGQGLGEYHVTFTWVGEGAGTYSYVHSDRWDREVHVYTGSGAYVDRVRVVPEVSSQVVHLAASTRPADWLEVSSEAARSKGHKQAAGGAWKIAEDAAYAVGARGSMAVPEVFGHTAGEVKVAAKRRWIGDGYLAVGRLRSPATLEAWAQDPGEGWEATNEVSLGYGLGEKVRTLWEIGSMRTASGDSRRRKIAIDLGSSRFGFSANSEVARLEGGSLRRGAERTAVGVRVPIKAVNMEVGRRSSVRDRLADDQTRMTVEYYSQARLSGRGTSVALIASRTDEDRAAAGDRLGAYSSSLDGRLEVEASAGRRLSARGQIAHRRSSYRPAAGLPDNATTGADIGISIRDLFFISSLALDYGLANTLTSTYSTKLVWVAGGGDYDSAGNYVPGRGGYEITRYEAGKQPVARMKAGLTLETGLKGKILVEKALSSRTRVEIEGETSGARTARLALPNPSYVLGGDEVVFGRASLAEEIVLNRARGLTVSLAARALRAFDARCAGRTERQQATEVVGRVASASLRKTEVSAEARVGSTSKSFETAQGEIGPSVRTLAASASFGRTLSASLRGRVGAGLVDERRGESSSVLTEANLTPGFTIFLGGLRCDGGLVARRLVRSENASAHDINMRNSLDWNARLNMRHGRYASLALEYVGRKARGAGAVHNLKASLSATF